MYIVGLFFNFCFTAGTYIAILKNDNSNSKTIVVFAMSILWPVLFFAALMDKLIKDDES